MKQSIVKNELLIYGTSWELFIIVVSLSWVIYTPLDEVWLSFDFPFRFLESSEGGIHGLKEWIHGLTWKMAACAMSWVFKRQGLCLWACFGSTDGTYSATLGGQQLFFFNSLSLAFRTTIHTHIIMVLMKSSTSIFFPSWLLKDHFPW